MSFPSQYIFVQLVLPLPSIMGLAIANDKSPSSPSLSSSSEISNLTYGFAVIFLIWYFVVLSLAYLGVVEIFRKFNHSITDIATPPSSSSSSDLGSVEGVTIIRPLKGIDAQVESCLESSFVQYYPTSKLEVLFCVEDPKDPVIPIVETLIDKYPNIDARLMIGDPNNPDHYGPNPKINNLAKGFVAAKHDIIWVMDSNVWASNGTLLRSVHALHHSLDNGRQTYDRRTGQGKPVKVVHHLPLAVSLKSSQLLMGPSWWSNIGSKLDEVFLKTSHAKFYVGFDRWAVAPCVNGKSNLYRRSDIDMAVQHIGRGQMPSVDGESGDLSKDAAYYGSTKGYGIRYFSKFIGEDNMIAIALWDIGGRTGLTGDCVIQPLGNRNSSIKDYILRRSRWLRVRKYMVLAATILEPTTESIVAGIYGTFAVSVLFFQQKFSISWLFFHFIVWYLTDYLQFALLLKYSAAEDSRIMNSSNYIRPFFTEPDYNRFFDLELLLHSPRWSRFNKSGFTRQCFRVLVWSFYWFMREILAFPIWVYAMVGTTIDWRGRPFIIKSDLTAEEM
ncbi:hypothetical protein DASC09_032820 [Saccharomycopsis crataegensis]|uniref:Ceramide glucosyltransferase n=1 Tax=Saccharomycopsis crataegensis TaxID=43959 RepID=A0AAV5QMX9_9ASCO|nr:hypothetical protein DASC09_032820 [Saccharomycopsis crataegensis]